MRRMRRTSMSARTRNLTWSRHSQWRARRRSGTPKDAGTRRKNAVTRRATARTHSPNREEGPERGPAGVFGDTWGDSWGAMFDDLMFLLSVVNFSGSGSRDFCRNDCCARKLSFEISDDLVTLELLRRIMHELRNEIDGRTKALYRALRTEGF